MLESPQYLTLSVIAIPAIAAVLCFLMGLANGGKSARRVALWSALLHVAATGFVMWVIFPNLDNRKIEGGKFAPLAVPGDESFSTRMLKGNTTWNLFSVGTLPSSELSVPPPAVQFYLGIDGLNFWLLPLASLITLCAVFLTPHDGGDQPGSFLGWLFLIETAAIGAFLSFDIILFFAFFEFTLIPAFFLIGHYGVGGGKRDAARKFFLYTLLGGAITLVGIVGLVAMNPTPIDEKGNEFVPTLDSMSGPPPKAGTITFSIPKLMRNASIWDLYTIRNQLKYDSELKQARAQLISSKTPAARQNAERMIETAQSYVESSRHRHTAITILFFALIAGFAVKLPIVPFHTWLPAAYGEAPAGITMFLSAVLAKLGAFGLLRLVVPLCPGPAAEYGMSVIGTLAAIGIVYCAFCAYAQTDIKRIAAYSSISHLGLLVLGVFALNVEGITGAIFHMIAHGLSAGFFFALLAFLYDRYGTLDSNRFGGLFARYPKFTFFFFVAALTGVGLPGLCNFIGEMLIISSMFTSKSGLLTTGPAIAACAGVFLSAWYTLTIVRKMFFGPVVEPNPSNDSPPAKDITLHEGIAFGLLAAGCLVLGIAPQPILNSVSAEANLLSNIHTQAVAFAETTRANDPQNPMPQRDNAP